MADQLVRGWLIAGRVQGVFFRESTHRQAAQLGIDRGHALNTKDGRVDVLAAGNAEQLAALEKWLATGPSAARVTSLLERFPDPDQVVPTPFCTGWTEDGC